MTTLKQDLERAGKQAVGKPSFNLEDWLYEKLGTDWCGNTSPPLNHRKMYTKDGYVVSLNNDGFETWIGRPDAWIWHTRNAEFRRIAWWAIRQHIFVDWCGLRSWLWYKLLHRRVTAYRAQLEKVK